MNCKSETVASALRAWCGEELASWSAKCLPCTEMQEDFGKLNQTKPNVFIFDIRGGIVTLRERPPSLVVGELARQRADRYLGFIQDVVTTYEIDVETTIAFDVGDGGGRVEKAPIFAFQKPAGSEIILFPDIDFLNNNFFTDKSFVDDHEYRAKSTTAIFVGSTSGANNTEQTVINLRSPRLRAAMYFKNQPRVEFLLPSIVQCDNEKTRDLIREMGFGQGGRIPWRHQLTHKFIISMDGNGATCSRVVLALRSNSVLLKYSSKSFALLFSSFDPVATLHPD